MATATNSQKKFRLLYVFDWSRYFEYMPEESAEDCLNKLDNWSLFYLHKYFVSIYKNVKKLIIRRKWLILLILKLLKLMKMMM